MACDNTQIARSATRTANNGSNGSSTRSNLWLARGLYTSEANRVGLNSDICRPRPSPRWSTEIKHTCAPCDLESKHVGVEDIEAYLSARLHHQDIAFK